MTTREQEVGESENIVINENLAGHFEDTRSEDFRRNMDWSEFRKLDTEATVATLENQRDIYYDTKEKSYCFGGGVSVLIFMLLGVAGFFVLQLPDAQSAVFLAPTSFPTTVSTSISSISPTVPPTSSPHFTLGPSLGVQPTMQPSRVSPLPTLAPTLGPSFVVQPTEKPSIANYTPTTARTLAPMTSKPTLTPTKQVSSSPTIAPIIASTIASTLAPTMLPPTIAPTMLPSLAPSSSSPTLSPTTLKPTLSPTESSEEPTSPIVSRLDCAAIQQSEEAKKGNFGEKNFKIIEINGRSFCGDTYGPDADRPNRNAWAPKIGRRDCPQYSYAEGERICDSVGARWCTVEEFILGVGHGTGCGGDSEPIYTLTNCLQNNTGISGKLMFNVGLSTPRTIETHCVTNQSVTSLVRCCGDMEVED